MSDAQQLKALGNQAFAQKNFEEALQHFSQAIELDGSDPVFFSNRSGVYASLNRFEEALQDADRAIQLKPEWAKAYGRRALALFKLNRLDEAEEAYSQGLEREPDNEQLKKGLSDVQSYSAGGAGAAGGANPFSNMFGPNMWAKIAGNPQLKQYLQQPDFVQILQQIQANPNSISNYLSDQRILSVMGHLMGINLSTGPPTGFDESFGDAKENQNEQEMEIDEDESGAADTQTTSTSTSTSTSSSSSSSSQQQTSAKPTPQSAPVDEKVSEERKQAEQEKELGNTAYRARKFDEAVEHYTRAADLDPTNPVYLTNRAAVRLEQARFDQCIEDCNKSIEVAHENHADYKLVAKAYARIGNAHCKQKQYQEAIAAYEKSLLEFPDTRVKRQLKETRQTLAKAEAEAYIDENKSLEAKNHGNEEFKNGNWVAAIEHFTEAIKRNPKDHRIYSNRAAAYIKVMDWQSALRDCDTCIAIDPTFARAYLRKGNIQFLCKEYHKALETYDKGLSVDPNNAEIKQGKAKTAMAISQSMSGEVDQERAQRAMADPEIQTLLKDPNLQQTLQDLQQDPSALNRVLSDPDMAKKIEKLMAAGILRTG